MEPALRGTLSATEWLESELAQRQPKLSDKIVPLVVPGAPGADPGPPPAASRDWSAALDLIRETGDAIKLAEDRANELQAKLDDVTAQAGHEIRQLEQKLASAAQLALKAEDRMRLAEQRAKEAEAWLARLYDAVMTSLGRKR